ncbi:hypothetical protein Sjap_020264 [Stephania japonica]|uniref:Protein arginine N-methyltransferase domain-containing protein n=1 Tax=Stephania japonica TaxID=461633 RepID=A0AAP0F324_9MAGN
MSKKGGDGDEVILVSEKMREAKEASHVMGSRPKKHADSGTGRVNYGYIRPEISEQSSLHVLRGHIHLSFIEQEQEQGQRKGGLPPNELSSSTSYHDMLNDSSRNRAFRQAIDKTLNKPCHVLDIGAGTGLLSMMAARAMDSCDAQQYAGSRGIVSACESYLPMVKLMRKVLRINGMETKVQLFPRRSDELKLGVDLATRADVLVSEILDSELLGEGLIPSLQHAHDMLLVKNPLTIPYRAITYGQLVESEFLWKQHDLYNNESKVLDRVHLVPSGLETVVHVKPQQYAMHCDALSNEIKLLSEPFKVFSFDFWRRPESHGETELKIIAVNNGTVHAIVSWWVLQLDYEGTIFYSTAPQWINSPIASSISQKQSWCDHWKQCVWFATGQEISVARDEQVVLRAVHDETSISYGLKNENPLSKPKHNKFCSSQLLLSPERVAVYGDTNWRLSFSTALQNAGKNCSLCIVADDSIFMTILIAQLSTTSHIISIFPGIREKGARYLQAVANSNGFSMDRVKVLGKRKTCLTMDNTDQRKAGMLVSEPFYCGNDGLPWQNLRFWKERTMFDSVLSHDVSIVPCRGILRACAMSLPDLWRSRCSLEMIEGLDHSVVNTTLGAYADTTTSEEGHCLPYWVWQCGEIQELSDPFIVMEFDFTRPISPCNGKSKVEFTKSGTCHGFVLWIDWVLDEDNSIVLSTGPRYRFCKQGVKLLKKPVEVDSRSGDYGTCRSAIIDASFDPLNGEVIVRHSFESAA